MMSLIVRPKELRNLGIPFSATWLRHLEREGRFPRRFNLSPKRIAWLRVEIEEFIARKAATREFHEG
jgi:prophage regulatory protein